MKLEPFKVLSDDEIRSIHEATVEILSGCGVKIDHPQMLEDLAGLGVEVDREAGVARFSRTCIEEQIARVPSTIEVFDRRGEAAFVIGEGRPKIAAGHNAVFWLDSETGETRSSKIEDVRRFSRICQRLEAIDLIGIPVMPQDVDSAEASLLEGVRAAAENSTKPIYFSTDSARVNRGCIDLLEAAFEGDFSRQVYAISQVSPTAPLFWERGVIDAIRDTVTTAVPLAILPEPNAGVSAPYTLAGLVTVNNAEAISGLVMIQLLRGGAGCLYANSWTTTDMRTGSALVGSTETSICRIAGAQMGRFYQVPTHTTAPNSDNHAHDEQNAWEKTFSTFCAVGAGNDLVVNCGMFATGMTCSHEQLVMDEEISAMALRISEGLQVDKDTVASELIRSVGPRGEYLMEEHTMHWLRSQEYLMPRVSVRGPRSAWEAEGAPGTTELARRRAGDLAAKGDFELDDARKARLAEIVEAFTSSR